MRCTFHCRLGLPFIVLALAACGAKNGSEQDAVSKRPDLPAFPAATAKLVIRGKVVLGKEGAKAENLNVSADSYCQECWKTPPLKESTRVAKDGGLPNVFVWLEGLETRWNFEIPEKPVKINQKGCLYIPHVVGVMAGQKIEVRNSDDTIHNVHLVARKNKQFNFQQKKDQVDLVDKLKRPELAILKCDIHPWMRQFVHIKPHPIFCVSQDDGTFELPAVPPGKYELRVWHELHGTRSQKIELLDGKPLSLRIDYSKKGN